MPDSVKSDITDFIRCVDIPLKFRVINDIEPMKQLDKVLEFGLLLDSDQIPECSLEIGLRLSLLLFLGVEQHWICTQFFTKLVQVVMAIFIQKLVFGFGIRLVCQARIQINFFVFINFQINYKQPGSLQFSFIQFTTINQSVQQIILFLLFQFIFFFIIKILIKNTISHLYFIKTKTITKQTKLYYIYINLSHSNLSYYLSQPLSEMAQQPNHYFGPSIRSSYGYQDQSNNRPNVPVRTFQPYSSSFQHENKISNTIKAMESRVDGVQALVRQKKNSINEDNIKSPSLNGPNNNFQVYEPVKFSNGFSVNASSSSLGEQRSSQLRGSCPNIFKKLDQAGSNLRSTTQFLNMGKWGLNNSNVSNDPSRKQSTNEEAQGTVPRPMKKHQMPFMNEQQSTTNPTSQSSKLLNIDSFAVSKAQTFNPNKSLSSGQLPSFRYNLNNALNKSNINNVNNNNNKDKLQKETYSPAKIVANRTPTKFSKINNNNGQSDKRSPEASMKNMKTTSNQNSLSASIAVEIKTSPNTGMGQFEQKKFKSLHEIWEIKQKQKTQKKISQSIKSNNIQKSKLINGFQIGKVLGKGKFGQVYLARHHETGFVTAIKKIVKSKVKQYKMIDQFSKQIKLHSALDHPNIVKFYGFFQQNDDIYLVIQYMNGGTLFDYLNEVYHLGVKETIQYLRDIIEAIVYLHEKSIAHRDIKPQNIVISSQGVAKLCDFGWSAIIQTSRKTYCGTFDYAPPEILQRKNYDMSVDVWCIGVLTYELLTGRVPFEGDKRNQIMEKIVNVDKNKIQYPIDIPKQAKDFIELLVQKDPNLRPKPSQLLKHPFFSLCPPKVKSKKLQ